MNESRTSTTTESGPIQIFRSVAEVPPDFGPTVAAIGNFDGVHLGHRENLSAVVAEARAGGAQAIAVTFDPHPERFLRPTRAPKLLTPMPERLRLLGETGIDAVLVLPFDAALASLSARNFVQEILVQALSVRSLHEGRNFRFGHSAEAGIAELETFGREFGFAVHVHEAVRTRGLEVSSSAIRAFIPAGDMRRSRWMLGRPFSIRSTQVRDRGVGAELLVPTINLAPYPELLPAFGVYVTRLSVSGREFQAVTNVGNRPTFDGAGFSIESHILNFEPIAADSQTPIELEFLLRLRGEVQWPSPEALKAQIIKDVARAKRYFRLLS